jgi:type II secretory pathway pseudopilin PulG
MRNARIKIVSMRVRDLLNSKGSVLVETMIAVTILGIIGTSVASSISTARISGTRVEETAIAETIARNHMESVFAASYQVPPTTYPELTGLDPGYASTAIAEVYIVDETRIEKIIVTVTRDSNQLMVIESLRTQE